jgi:peptidoglycan hydrolase-like protein with peptidoglycan-binding domain
MTIPPLAVMGRVYHEVVSSIFQITLKNTGFPRCKYILPRIGTSRSKPFIFNGDVPDFKTILTKYKSGSRYGIRPQAMTGDRAMGEKTRNDLWKIIPVSIMLLTFLMAGCAGPQRPTPPVPETPKGPSETVSPPQRGDPKPGQDSSPPPESPPAPPKPRIVEKILPQPEMVAGVSPQPDVKKDPQTQVPSAEKSPQPAPKANALLNPAVPDDARIIQTRLAELGFYDLPIDGIWGKGSRTALMAFKEENSLGSSDTWDNETQTLLLRETQPAGHPAAEPDHHPISGGAIILNPSDPSDAKNIQARLAELGLYKGPIDGIWGKGSRAGLRLFKQEHALKNPDMWDKETQMLLFRGTNQ